MLTVVVMMLPSITLISLSVSLSIPPYHPSITPPLFLGPVLRTPTGAAHPLPPRSQTLARRTIHRLASARWCRSETGHEIILISRSIIKITLLRGRESGVLRPLLICLLLVCTEQYMPSQSMTEFTSHSRGWAQCFLFSRTFCLGIPLGHLEHTGASQSGHLSVLHAPLVSNVASCDRAGAIM